MKNLANLQDNFYVGFSNIILIKLLKKIIKTELSINFNKQ